jgi:hypothetical protein
MSLVPNWKLLYWQEIYAAGEKIRRLRGEGKRGCGAVSKKKGEGPVFDVMMPNGKRLGDCTGEEIGKFGEEMFAFEAWLKQKREASNAA